MRQGLSPRSGAALILALVASGCVAGPSGPSPTDPVPSTTTTPATTTTTLTVEEGLAGYQACLRDEGVAIGEISRDGLGRPRMAEAFTGLNLGNRAVLDALEHCGPHISSGALDLSLDPELQELVQSGLEEYVECVRLRGVADFPDPVPGFDGVGSPFPVDFVPWTDPELPAAVAKCSAALRS